jgi:disease resistance protein RPM1
MAETVVNLVLGKLADAAIQEALSLCGVSEKVRWVQSELTWIQSFLKDADSKRPKDERVKCWVNEVREVGFLIEDALDKFLLEVEGEDGSEGLYNKLRRIGNMPWKTKMTAKHKIGAEIEDIQQRLLQISNSTTKYGIQGLKEKDSTSTSTSTPASNSSSSLPIRPLVIPDLDKTEVIGFEADSKMIVDQLLDADTPRRSVISIVGAGGSGKTTLAKEVYKR